MKRHSKLKNFTTSVLVGLALISGNAIAQGTEKTIDKQAVKYTAQEITTGKDIAEKFCARCHSIAINGESPNAKAPAFRTFASKWPIESLEEALAEGIVVGEHVMPEFKFAPPDITNLLAYIGSLAVMPTK